MTDVTGAGATRPPLFVINGDATAEEVAALAVVLQAMAAATAAPPPPRPRSQWAHPRRAVRPRLFPGRDGWRSSALPG